MPQPRAQAVCSPIAGIALLGTLAVAMDNILSVDLGAATDVLIQQYKSVEQLHSDGGTWRTARHASVVGDGRVSIMADTEREGLLRDERKDTTVKKIAAETFCLPPS